jgi:hypothetical protein
MLKSKSIELKEQLKKLEIEIKEIETKESEKYRCIKAIIKYTHTFWEKYKINNIYFDTYGFYEVIKESNHETNWIVKCNNFYKNYTYNITNKTTNEKYKGGIQEYKTEYKYPDVISTHNIGLVRNSNDVWTLSIWEPKDKIKQYNLYIIMFNPYIINYEDSIDLSNQIIRFYLRKMKNIG